MKARTLAGVFLMASCTAMAPNQNGPTGAEILPPKTTDMMTCEEFGAVAGQRFFDVVFQADPELKKNPPVFWGYGITEEAPAEFDERYSRFSRKSVDKFNELLCSPGSEEIEKVARAIESSRDMDETMKHMGELYTHLYDKRKDWVDEYYGEDLIAEQFIATLNIMQNKTLNENAADLWENMMKNKQQLVFGIMLNHVAVALDLSAEFQKKLTDSYVQSMQGVVNQTLRQAKKINKIMVSHDAAGGAGEDTPSLSAI